MGNLKLTLLENAEHFIEESINCAVQAEKDERKWKFAILHIVQAIELYLKELLSREHNILIYANIDKPNHTVSLLHALKRINDIAGISFSEDDVTVIKYAVDIRNQFTHSTVEFTVDQLKASYYTLVGFLQDTFEEHDGRHLSEIISSDLWTNVVAIQDFINELRERADDIIQNNFTVVCPVCGMETFILDEQQCCVCKHEEMAFICCDCEDLIFGDPNYIAISENEEETICESCLNNRVWDDYREQEAYDVYIDELNDQEMGDQYQSGHHHGYF